MLPPTHFDQKKQIDHTIVDTPPHTGHQYTLATKKRHSLMNKPGCCFQKWKFK